MFEITTLDEYAIHRILSLEDKVERQDRYIEKLQSELEDTRSVLDTIKSRMCIKQLGNVGLYIEFNDVHNSLDKENYERIKDALGLEEPVCSEENSDE